MRTPVWESSPGALAALLHSRAPLHKADAWAVTLPSGAVHRWSGSDAALTLGGNTYALGPGLVRNRVRLEVGVQVSTLDITITDIAGTLIAGQPLLAFIARRGLFGAQFDLLRVFWGAADAGPVGALLWFRGAVGECSVDRREARVQVTSATERFNVMLPREVYQPGCLNTLYDARCGINRAAHTVTGSAFVGSGPARHTIGHQLAQASGHFDLGVITITSGANAGIARAVKWHSQGLPGGYGQIRAMQPWPFPVETGATFSIVPGCDKRLATCIDKFANKARFRGMPYVPVPETVL